MDIETLKALGVSVESLQERIIEQAVDTLLSYTGYDEDGEETGSYASKFRKQIEQRVQATVDAKIAALAEVHVIPRVGELIEQADMRKTNNYGEPKGDPMTFKEYIASRAEAYMAEDVDHNGKSKSESGDAYNWRTSGPRLTVLMKMYIQQTMEKAAKTALTDVNAVIAKNIEKAARDAIAAASAGLQIAVKA